MRLILIATALLLNAAPATFAKTSNKGRGQASGPMEIFGLQLGAPFALPECAERFPISVAATCWKYQFPGSDTEARLLFFPKDPALGSVIRANVIDGTLQIVTIETGGIDTQDDVMAQLKAKFGKPTAFHQAPVQNRFGAKYRADRAEWSLPQCFVQFDADGSDGGSHAGTLDGGWISITSRQFHDQEARRLRKRLSEKQPL